MSNDQTKDYSDLLLDKLVNGYGYPLGISSMPDGLGTTAKKLHQSLLHSDLNTLQSILHPDNKISRKAFENLFDGRIKLPKTVKGTKEMLTEFFEKIQAQKEKSE